MDELSEICAGAEPGFCQEAKNFNNPLVEMIKKNKGVRTNLKKKWKVNPCQSLWGWGKTNSVANFLSLSLSLHTCAGGGTALTQRQPNKMAWFKPESGNFGVSS